MKLQAGLWLWRCLSVASPTSSSCSPYGSFLCCCYLCYLATRHSCVYIRSRANSNIPQAIPLIAPSSYTLHYPALTLIIQICSVLFLPTAPSPQTTITAFAHGHSYSGSSSRIARTPTSYTPISEPLVSAVSSKNSTHAGQPTATANAARIVFPFPYPRAANIAGAKSGKPKPARDRKNETAARAVGGEYNSTRDVDMTYLRRRTS